MVWHLDQRERKGGGTGGMGGGKEGRRGREESKKHLGTIPH